MVMGTASTMASLVEALGIGFPFNAALPAVDSRRGALAHLVGRRIVSLIHDDVRMSRILTRAAFENAIRVLGLDREHLAAIAARIGPTVDDVTGRTPELDPRLLANWDARGGYLKPAEVVDADELDVLLGEDMELVGTRR